MKDNSAMSKSRPSFRMPKNSPDDSKAAQVSSKTLTSSKDNKNNNALTWNPLGLYTQVVDCLEQDLKLAAPTPIQSMVIPELLSRPRDSFAFLAATGSGKTLAYLLPLMQQLKHQEDFESYERRPRRPRVLILAPTRELVSQITGVLKTVSHSFKVSSLALVGGQQKGQQAKSLSREVDIVVATPGRLLQHWKDGNIFFGQVDSIVLDEMDTMLEQGFQQELRSILYPLLYPGGKAPKDIVGGLPVPPSATQFKDSAPRIILTSATMTQMVQKSLGDNPKTSKLTVTAKKNFVKKRGENDKDPQHKQQQRAGEQPPTATTLKLPPMKIISAPGLHRTVPRLDQVFVDVGSTDKVRIFNSLFICFGPVFAYCFVL
jgi:superfamily II DNA/RNA helicase